jgi:hypothetical protein
MEINRSINQIKKKNPKICIHDNIIIQVYFRLKKKIIINYKISY